MNNLQTGTGSRKSGFAIAVLVVLLAGCAGPSRPVPTPDSVMIGPYDLRLSSHREALCAACSKD